MPIVSGRTETLSHDTALVEHLWDFEHIPPSEGVRTDKWKYMRYVNNKSIEELSILKTILWRLTIYLKMILMTTKQELRVKLDELAEKLSDGMTSLRPIELSVEFIREPKYIKVVDLTPEFSWVVPTVPLVERVSLLLASSIENINNNIGDIWDPGRLGSNVSTNVTYKGEPLKTGKTYYWKVCIWDIDNRTSGYSKTQQFTTGEKDKWFSTGNIFQ